MCKHREGKDCLWASEIRVHLLITNIVIYDDVPRRYYDSRGTFIFAPYVCARESKNMSVNLSTTPMHFIRRIFCR